MPVLQLSFDIVLCTTGIVSAFVCVVDAREKDRQVQLPTYELDGEENLDDPFDVTKPEDIIDGYPIREDKFWARVRLVTSTYLSALTSRRFD